MTGIYIPDLGEEIILALDWKFTAYPEFRNRALFINVKEHSAERRRLLIIERKAYNECCEWCRLHSAGCLNNVPTYAKWKDAETTFWAHDRNILRDAKPKPYTLKAGTRLIVDRVYIRKGAADFSSVTFKMLVGKATVRFWVKLTDANTIFAL